MAGPEASRSLKAKVGHKGDPPGPMEDGRGTSVQAKPDLGQDFPQVVASSAQEGVHRVALHALEEVSSQQPVVLHVADLGFHGRTPPEVSFQGVAELAGAADEDPAPFYGDPMGLVASVHEGGLGDLTGEPFDLVELALQGVAVIGVIREGLDAHDETLLVGHGQAHLHPELVRLVGLALGDALHLGGMEAVDLALGEALLGEDLLRQDEGAFVGLEGLITHLPFDIPHHSACHGLQGSQDLPGPAVLLGLGMATMLLIGPGHQFSVALAKGDAFLFGNAEHGGVDLPVEPGIGRMLHGLGLHRRVDDDLLQAALGDDASLHPCRDRCLEQLLNALLANALAPAGHLAWINGQGMLEELLPAKELPVGVLDPPAYRLLIGDALEVLEVMEARHKPDRYCRPSVVGAVQGAEFLRQVVPGDRGRQANQFMVHVQGQVEAHGGDQGLLVSSGLGFRLHRYTAIRGFVPTFLVYQILEKFP